MAIISFSGEAVPQGDFLPTVTVIGGSREECIAALQSQCHFADDIGSTLREDGQEIYTMIGGSIR